MGKASTNKKVARAAGISGGRSHRRNTPWGYFGVIALIVVLGVVGTVTSRDRRLHQITSQGNVAPTVGTTWNEGYAVYACGKFLEPLSTKSSDPQGITTRTLGLILIKPATKDAAGKNATLGKFATATGMKLNAAELQIPGGKLYQDGDSCEGKAGHVYVKQFASTADKVGQLFNGDTKTGQLAKLDPRNVPLSNQLLLTIAFVPADEASSIPPPPSYVDVNLSKATSTATTTTTLPTVSTTTPKSATTVKAGSTAPTTSTQSSSTTVSKS